MSSLVETVREQLTSWANLIANLVRFLFLLTNQHLRVLIEVQHYEATGTGYELNQANRPFQGVPVERLR